MFLEKHLLIFKHKSRTCIDIGLDVHNTISHYSPYFDICYGYEQSNSLENKITFLNSNAIIYNGKFESLDEEFQEKNITQIDFVNIDVNGRELFFLKGAIQTIITWKPMIRFNSSMSSFHNYSIYPMECIEFLSKLGYRGFDNSDPDRLVMYCPNESHGISTKMLYTFWTGFNQMSQNRKNCLEQLREVSEANVLLIDANNFQDYILQIEPLHPGFTYLSETHKADYLRCYFMHFYGGGYSDIKYTTASWIKSFEEMSDPSNNKTVCGYKEIGPHGVPVIDLREKWECLIGGGCYICKPNTDFTTKWYNRMIEVLDQKLDLLKANPSKYPQDCSEDGTGYPLAWQEILGRIFHQVCYEERDKVSQSLPILLFHSYR
jgi:hypothetical protein